MRVPLEKIGGMRINEKNLTLTVHYDSGKRKDIKIASESECLLCVNSKRIPCKVSTKTDGKKGKVSVSLSLKHDVMILNELFPYLFRAVESSLVVEERVPRDIYERASKLLTALAVKTGRPEQELLEELTAFKKGVEGRTDLKFVSEAMMIVIIDKMQDAL